MMLVRPTTLSTGSDIIAVCAAERMPAFSIIARIIASLSSCAATISRMSFSEAIDTPKNRAVNSVPCLGVQYRAAARARLFGGLHHPIA